MAHAIAAQMIGVRADPCPVRRAAAAPISVTQPVRRGSHSGGMRLMLTVARIAPAAPPKRFPA